MFYLYTQAINKRDFSTFAELTMRDSNSFHAVCLDTFPPCVYMNQASPSIIIFYLSVHIYLLKYDIVILLPSDKCSIGFCISEYQLVVLNLTSDES